MHLVAMIFQVHYPQLLLLLKMVLRLESSSHLLDFYTTSQQFLPKLSTPHSELSLWFTLLINTFSPCGYCYGCSYGMWKWWFVVGDGKSFPTASDLL